MRKLSLINLFNLFLPVADPTFLPEIAMPRRASCKAFCLAMTIKQLSMDRHEERKTCLNSRGRVNLLVWANRPGGTVALNSQPFAALGPA